MFRSSGWRWSFLGGGLLVLIFLFGGSLVWGYTSTTWQDAIRAFTQPTGRIEEHVILDLRTPRAVVALTVGAALAVAGTLMQVVTRNPLAGPSLMGLNAGAGLAVVVAMLFLPVSETSGFVGFAFLGAGVAALVAYGVASTGREGATPLKMTLAGAAVSALLSSLTSGLLVLNESSLQSVMFWMAGSVEGRPLSLVVTLLPFLLMGLLMAGAIAPSLNTFALGESIATGLGMRTGRVRLVAFIAVLLLAGSCVAIAGPIGFIGLVVPHIARAIVGPDYPWLLPTAALLGAALLLLADIGARFILFPREVPVGVVTALIGAPFFIQLARRRLKTA